MDILTHYHHNKCLFKCDKILFANNIKNVLTKLFSHDDVNYDLSYIFTMCDRYIKCTTCLQIICTVNMSLTNPFLICDNCVHACIGEHVYVELYDSGPFGKIFSYWFKYENNGYAFTGMRYATYKYTLIDNSHKLIHRFYHDVEIILLLSISDINSYCNVLNFDVIIHILRFIY